ncbi:hypothetical protein KL934_004557 [Ogataea polymorpha]|nr:hypothetical protein KL934_004557 [Ogataea polymorpha]
MVAAVKKHVWILYQNRIVAYSTTSLVFPYLLVNYSSSIFYNFLYIDIELHGGAQLHRVQKVDAVVYDAEVRADQLGTTCESFWQTLCHAICKHGHHGDHVWV